MTENSGICSSYMFGENLGWWWWGGSYFSTLRNGYALFGQGDYILSYLLIFISKQAVCFLYFFPLVIEYIVFILKVLNKMSLWIIEIFDLEGYLTLEM